jgi:hypothetical protein
MPDIGHGVFVEARRVDGVLHGFAYSHPAPDGKTCSGAGWIPVKPEAPDGWDVVGLDPLTLSPSLLCRACGHHGFIREGRWVPA